MNPCDEIRARMAFYLDDELRGNEKASFEAHLKDCEPCRRLYNKERSFLESIRQSRPLYASTPELRNRVEQILTNAPAPLTAPAELRRRIQRSVSNSFRLSSDRRLLALAASITILIMVVAVWKMAGRNSVAPKSPPSDFALNAVDAHMRHLRGALPLEITSASPERISEWFAGKVPFSLKLPKYQESSGQEQLYRLEGARLIGFKDDYAAYVAYQMRMRPISLVVTSNAVAMPSGGEEIVSKGITFHYDSIEGFNVITWSDRELTYALVSDLEERGQQSCIMKKVNLNFTSRA